jgi:hypothetical protein
MSSSYLVVTHDEYDNNSFCRISQLVSRQLKHALTYHPLIFPLINVECVKEFHVFGLHSNALLARLLSSLKDASGERTPTYISLHDEGINYMHHTLLTKLLSMLIDLRTIPIQLTQDK